MKVNLLLINKYCFLYKPDHPRAHKKGAHKGYIQEHNYVAELMLGRPLRDNEEVHHFNFNTLDNRISNIVVLEKAQHMKLHRLLKTSGLDKILKANSTEGHHNTLCKGCQKYLIKYSVYCDYKCRENHNGNKNYVPNKKQMRKMLKENMDISSIANEYATTRQQVIEWLDRYGLEAASSIKRH